MTTHKAIREARQRVAAFLDERSRMRGVCPELITGANDCPLLVDDLRALLADLDAKTAEVERLQELVRNAPEFFAPQHDFEGRKLQWVVEADTALKGTT